MRQWDPKTIRERIDSAVGLICYAESAKTILWSLDLAGFDLEIILETELKECVDLEGLRDKALDLIIKKEEFYEDVCRN